MKGTRKNLILNMFLILFGSILLGTILLWAVYYLPVMPMQKHMKESIEEFVQEGDNPFLMDGYKGSSLDNSTDAIMLEHAVYKSDLPVYKAAMMAERGDNADAEAQEDLQIYLQGKEMDQISTYARYWHGYLVILKPLLLFFNFQEIRLINGLFVMILTCIAIWLMYRRSMKQGIAAFALALASLFPITIPRSLQFSSIYYIGILACIVLLGKYERLEEKGWWLYYFTILGILTSYFDFLTYPLFTLGMPMILYIAMKRLDLKEGFIRIVQICICWGYGYVGMWAGKWVVGSVLTGNNILLDAAGAIGNRMSNTVYEEKVNRIMAVLRNGYIYFNLYGVVLAALLLGWIGWYIWKHRNHICMSGIVLMTGIAFIPIVWYLCTANHSFSHYWFTFRSLSVSVFAIGMIPESCKVKS